MNVINKRELKVVIAENVAERLNKEYTEISPLITDVMMNEIEENMQRELDMGIALLTKDMEWQLN